MALPVVEINPPLNKLAPVMFAPLVIVLVALINPPVRILPCVALPVVEINPPLNKLPPVMLPVALAVPPVAKLPPVMVAVALTAPIKLPPRLVVPETKRFAPTTALADLMSAYPVTVMVLLELALLVYTVSNV